MSEYRDFSSLPPDKEGQFVVYEKRSVEAGKKAMTIGIVASALFGILTVIIVFSHDPPKNKMADDDLGMLKRAAAKQEAAAPAPAPAPDPAADDSAEAAAPDDTGSADEAGEAAVEDSSDGASEDEGEAE